MLLAQPDIGRLLAGSCGFRVDAALQQPEKTALHPAAKPGIARARWIAPDARLRHAGTGVPFQLTRVQPSCGFPVSTTCAVLGSELFVGAMSAFFAFIRTQHMMASP